jgi:hypothetical protein
MGDYTRVGLVRSATGFTDELSPSGTVNFSIRRGESAMKKYLRLTPASGANTEAWVEDASTSFAAYYLSLRLASMNIANVRYQRQDVARQGRSSDMLGEALNAQMWYGAAVKICDMHGRDVIVKRIDM